MNDVFESQKRRIKELEEAVIMADNRLEAALLGDEDICRCCVELARSYLGSVKPSDDL